jgi:hypothetical protein
MHNNTYRPGDWKGYWSIDWFDVPLGRWPGYPPRREMVLERTLEVRKLKWTIGRGLSILHIVIPPIALWVHSTPALPCISPASI